MCYIQYFSVKINTDMKASSFKKDQKVNMDRISIKYNILLIKVVTLLDEF